MVYLHVCDWPQGGETRVSGMAEITDAYLLGDTSHASLPVAREGDSVIVNGPPEAPNAIDTVVVLPTE